MTTLSVEGPAPVEPSVCFGRKVCNLLKAFPCWIGKLNLRNCASSDAGMRGREASRVDLREPSDKEVELSTSIFNEEVGNMGNKILWTYLKGKEFQGVCISEQLSQQLDKYLAEGFTEYLQVQCPSEKKSDRSWNDFLEGKRYELKFNKTPALCNFINRIKLMDPDGSLRERVLKAS